MKTTTIFLVDDHIVVREAFVLKVPESLDVTRVARLAPR